MLTGFRLVAEFELRALLAHRATWIRLIFIEPLTYLLLLGAGLQGMAGYVHYGESGLTYLSFVFPGILGMQLLRIFTHSIYRLTIDRRWGLQALKMSSGIKPWSYLFGMQVIPVALFYAQVGVAYPLAVMLGVKASWTGIGAFTLVSIAGSLFWTSLAMVLTFFVRNYSHRDLWLTFLILPLTFSAPVFYNLQNAPRYLQVLSHFNPLTYQVQAMRSAFLEGIIGIEFVISLVGALTLTLLARLIIARAEFLAIER